jgi:hypothetical protein
MKKITLIAAAIAALGVSAQASAAFTATPIVFDMNGAAAGGAINVTSFDWTPGNALAKDAIGSTTGQFTTYFQASLGSFIYNNGGGSTTFAPFVGSEFTVQATILEQGTGVGSSNASFTSLGGSYKIFYDTNAATKANDLTGQGYGDGLMILEGTINAGGTGAFQNQTILGALLEPLLGFNPFPTTNLDGFVNNDRPGIYSNVGNGSSTLTVDVTYTDSNFFKSNIKSLAVDINDTTNLAAPFNQANPSEEVVGQTPNYGVDVVGGVLSPVNGAGCGDVTVGTTCDFHFQSDSSTSFQATVPEPGSLAIAGAGLALMSLVRRRKAK